MSSTRQAVILGPNLTGGKRFDFTPAHQVLFDTGIGPYGAMIFLSRMKPVSGRQNFLVGNFDSVMAELARNFHSVLFCNIESRSRQNLLSSCVIVNFLDCCLSLETRRGGGFRRVDLLLVGND